MEIFKDLKDDNTNINENTDGNNTNETNFPKNILISKKPIHKQ